MRIEPLCDRPDLLSDLALFHYREWGPLRPGETLEQRADRIKAICGRTGVPSAFVATDGAQLLGSALLIPYDMQSRNDLTPWVAGVYVVQEARRRGIGSALMEHVAEQAKLSGIPNIYLYTDKSETFYARLGWKVIDRCIEKGLPVVVMARALAA